MIGGEGINVWINGYKMGKVRLELAFLGLFAMVLKKKVIFLGGRAG